MNTETILSTIQLWKDHPRGAQVRPLVTARSEGPQTVIETGAFSWRADLPEALGGTNQAPSPTALLLGALAACAVVLIRDTLAPLLNVTITEVRATVSAQTDFRGLLGPDGAPPDLDGLALDIEVTSPQDERAVRGVIQAWMERCPVYLALVKPMAVTMHTAIRRR